MDRGILRGLALALGARCGDRLRRLPAKWLWGATGVLAVAFAVVDVARGSHPQPLLWVQVACGLALVASVFLALWRGGRPGRELLAPAVLALLLLGVFVNHVRVLHSDGFLYYSYLRSMLFDGDLDLHNDFTLLGPPNNPDLINPLPVGAPICWSPFVLTLHAFWNAARLFGAPAPQGVEPAYQAAACFASLVYGALALFLLYALVRRWTSPTTAFFTTLVCWWAFPLRFYLAVEPSFAHSCEFFASVLVLWTTLRLRDGLTLRSVMVAGAAVGLLTLVRTQHGLLVILPAAEILAGVRWRTEPRRLLKLSLACAAAFALVVLPQMLVWQAMFGRPITVPYTALHGQRFMQLDHPHLLGMLISPRGGLFTSHPAAIAGLLGLVWLAVRGVSAWRADGRWPLPDRRYAVVALTVFAAGFYLNASIFDWYHVRRFTGLVPLLAPGVALALSALVPRGLVALAALVFLLGRYDLEIDALRHHQGDPAPVRAILRRVPDGLAYDAYRLLEPWAPRASATLLAAYTGEGVLNAPVTRLVMAHDLASLRLPRPARNLSGVEYEDGRACRWVRADSASIFVSVARRSPFVLSVHARALETAAPQAMQVFWNGERLGRQVMAPRWEAHRFRVPLAAVRAGTNRLDLRFERSPVYRRVRGEGPREVRPAALSRIDFHLPPDAGE
jgi:hypothetical protein